MMCAANLLINGITKQLDYGYSSFMGIITHKMLEKFQNVRIKTFHRGIVISEL
jgi:hypothetical protein